MKKVTLMLFLLSIFVLPVKAFDYEINNYDINIIVNENNVLDINEEIDVDFNVPKHGIFRSVPMKNKVVRLDGTTSYNRVKITNILVSDSYTIYNESGNKIIKIGSANRTITGPKSYNLSFSYNLGKDTGKGYDELYFNLIGPDWDTSINGVSFIISMPKSFDESKVGFSVGNVGSTNSEDVSYIVDGKIIKGMYNKTIYPKQALTIRVELPEGYFVGSSNNIDFWMLFNLIAPIAFVVISLLIWFIFGRDKRTIEPIEFYAPDNLNSAELGYAFKGKAIDKDIVSLIVYLANKGYLKIIDESSKIKHRDALNFKLVRLKDYDGNNEIEKTLLEDLFKKSDEVSRLALEHKFYKTIEKIKKVLDTDEKKYKLFTKSSMSKLLMIWLMMILIVIFITSKPVLESFGVGASIYSLVFPTIAFCFAFVNLTHKTRNMKEATILDLIVGGLVWYALVLPSILQDSIYLVTYIVGIACIILLYLLSKIIPKRTEYGNQLLGKIKGFKRFLKTAEKEKLEALVMENPTYFYDVLPFTYVLDISDKWIKKFETVAVNEPDWYSGEESFNMKSFNNFVHNTMTSATTAKTSYHSSSHGSSGGGSSGGGSGGGGGGSW